MEADGSPFTTLPLSVLHFTDIQSYIYMDQRKAETDDEVTENGTGTSCSESRALTNWATPAPLIGQFPIYYLPIGECLWHGHVRRQKSAFSSKYNNDRLVCRRKSWDFFVAELWKKTFTRKWVLYPTHWLFRCASLSLSQLDDLVSEGNSN